MNDAITAVAALLSDIIGIYSFLVMARVFLSFKNPIGQAPQGSPDGINGLVGFLARICDPYLGFFKKIFYKGTRFDFSPMWALVTLNVVKSILNMLSSTGRITFGAVFVSLYSTLWSSVFSFIIIILIIVLIIRITLERKIDPRSMQFKDIIDRMINGIVFKVYNLFYKNRAVSDLRLIQTTLGVFIGLEVLGTIVNRLLQAWLL